MLAEATDWQRFMADAQARVAHDPGLEVRGTLTRLTGLVLEATGIRVPVGSQCLVRMGTQPGVLASNGRLERVPALISDFPGMEAAMNTKGELRTTPDMFGGVDGFYAAMLRVNA